MRISFLVIGGFYFNLIAKIVLVGILSKHVQYKWFMNVQLLGAKKT
ncbi:hypothetical protein SAMN06298216_1750 [Spirosomataceae bacterium TFI 002]|nr:hypothetical protein SAMN06298216_1750 [Spirosomataceae bacterium TFI 002]